MIRQINIKETRQHLGIQALSTGVMLYPLQKKQAPDWQISTSRGSAPEIDHGRGVSLRFCCYIVSLGVISLFCFVGFVLFSFVVFSVLFCLFLFRISSMEHLLLPQNMLKNLNELHALLALVRF